MPPPLLPKTPVFTDRRKPETLHGAVFLFVVAAWLVLGLAGHSPWKPEEGHVATLVKGLVAGGDWTLPRLHGRPWTGHPPLYYLVAAGFARLTAAWLPLHDGARLASGFFMGAALLLAGWTARRGLGDGYGRINVLLLIGSLGMLVKAHLLTEETGLLAGLSLGLAGISLQRRPVTGGLMAGAGIGVAFLMHGTPEAAMLLGVAALAPFCVRRSERPPQPLFWTCLAVAALPLLAVWPWLLAQQSPAQLHDWLRQEWAGRWLLATAPGHPVDPSYFLRNLPWFAWPALPVALWSLWQMRRTGLIPFSARVHLVAFILFLAVLSLTSLPHEASALPLLLPVAHVASQGAGSLRRGAASALDWFGAMTLALFCGATWLAWIALISGHPARVSARLHFLLPGFSARLDWPAVAAASLLTLVWVFHLVRLRRSPYRPLVNWAVGLTLLWGLLSLLLMPYIDGGKSYAGMMAQLDAALPVRAGCLDSVNVGAAQRSMLEYYTGRVARPARGTPSCAFVLEQHMLPAKPFSPGAGWRVLWQGARPGDRTERFVLYGRDAGTGAR